MRVSINPRFAKVVIFPTYRGSGRWTGQVYIYPLSHEFIIPLHGSGFIVPGGYSWVLDEDPDVAYDKLTDLAKKGEIIYLDLSW